MYMKAFYILVLLVFLASCGTPTAPNDPVSPEAPVSDSSEVEEEVSAELDEEEKKIIEDLISVGDETEDSESETEVMEKVEESDDISETMEKEETSREQQEVEASEEEPTQETPVVEEQAAAPKVVQLATTYNNPKWEVDMNISYTLGSDGKISQISVTSPNYSGMTQVNSKVQAVIGMSVKEASDFYISGSSLATPAFQKALKWSL